MAITSNSYTGNGSTTLYSFTFPYLDESHVKVTLAGTLTTAYTFANATTIQFNTAPGAGVAIRIYRETNNDQTEATFFAGSSIKAQDLNNNFTQTLYTVQEVVDRYLSKVGDTMQGILNMGGFKITNLGAPTLGTDATTKTYVDTQDALKVNKAGDTMSGNLAMGGNKVTGLGSPSGSADAATKSYVDGYINTTYLGPSATDPTTRPGGSPLQVGDQYFNTNQNILKAWTGTVWVISAAAGSIVRWRKTASAGNTTLSGVDDLGITLSYVVGNEQVYLNGALQTRGVDYTAATGTSITLTPALLAGDVVELHAVQGYVSATVPDGSVGETKLAAGAVTSAKIADGTIVDADVNASAGIVASKLSFTQAGAGATARTVDSKLKDVVSVKDFGAVGNWNTSTHTGTDDTTAIQAAVNSGKAVYFPTGSYKISSTIILPPGASIFGDGWAKTGVFAYGCDGFRLQSNTNVVAIERMEISSYSALNAIDPKVWSGISCEGTSSQICSWVTARDLRMRGWGICIDWRYTWNSVIDKVDTGFCAQAVRLFGQSVNNSINNSSLTANTGDYGIHLDADGSTIGEGLMVSNTLIASSVYGIYGDNGFLSLNVSNCVIDLISDKGISVVDSRAMMISNCWIYATNRGIEFPALGTAVTLGSSIVGNKIIVTAASGIPVSIGPANNGITLTGGSLEAVNGSGVYVQGGNVTVAGVNIVSANTNGINFDGGDGCVALGNTGKNTVLYGTRAFTSKQILTGSALQFPVSQVASSDPNTLDDYEEGTWTPLISTDGLGVTTFTSTTASGSYIKVGRLVTVNCIYTYSARPATNDFAFMSGLPFPIANNSIASIAQVAVVQTAFDTRSYYALALPNTSLLAFQFDNGEGTLYSGGAPYMVNLSFVSAATVRFTATYLAAA